MNKNNNIELNEVITQLQQTDYTFLLQTLNCLAINVIAGLTVSTGYVRYKIYKDYQPKKISKVALPPRLRKNNSDIDIEKVASKKLGDFILEFAQVLKENFPESYLINFYNNINDLKINPKKSKKGNELINTIAAYNDEKNMIMIDCDKHVYSIFHELFHMASSVNKDNVRYNGFHQCTKKNIIGYEAIGKGINEGYTELLTKRYFGYVKPIKNGKSYPFEVSLAEKLEQIIGRKKMEELYFTANLQGLIDELKKYAKEEDIAEFISGIDNINKNSYSNDLLKLERKMLEKKFKKVNEFLLTTYEKKLSLMLDNKDIDRLTYGQNLSEYIEKFPSGYLVGKYFYEVLEIEVLEELMLRIKNKLETTEDNLYIPKSK